MKKASSSGVSWVTRTPTTRRRPTPPPSLRSAAPASWHICIDVHVPFFINTHKYVYIYIYTHTYTRKCVCYINIYTHPDIICVHMVVYAHTHICIHVFACLYYVNICIYTNICSGVCVCFFWGGVCPVRSPSNEAAA